MKIFAIYIAVALVVISIDMSAFLTADRLDKETFTSPLDFLALLLFLLDIPFMMISSIFMLLLSPLEYVIFGHGMHRALLLGASEHEFIFLRLVQDILICSFLGLVWHVAIFTPIKYWINKQRRRIAK